MEVLIFKQRISFSMKLILLAYESIFFVSLSRRRSVSLHH